MLRLKIDRQWEPEDFIEVLEATESLYYKALGYRRRPFAPEIFFLERRGSFLSYDERLDSLNDWLLKEHRMTTHAEIRLQIKCIEYASPGGIDFAGLGQAMEAIDRSIGRMIEFFTERRKRREGDKQAKLETSIKEIELAKEQESLRAIQIANAREILSLRREYPDELEELLLPLAVRDQEKLASRIAEQKLVGVKRIKGGTD
jgi:hypothetical protein